MSPEAIIAWRVNRSSIVHFSDISTDSIREKGVLVFTLTIPIRSEYSGIEVVCLAVFLNGSSIQTIQSPPATLILTGL